MLITREMILEHTPCGEGLDWFDLNFPTGSGEYQAILDRTVEDGHSEYGHWLLDEIGQTRDHVELDTLDGDRIFCGSLTLRSGKCRNLRVAGDLDVGLSLNVGKHLNVGGSMNVGKHLDVGWSMNVGDSLTVGCSLDVGGSLTVGDSLTVGWSLDVGWRLTVGCSLDVGRWVLPGRGPVPERGPVPDGGLVPERGRVPDHRHCLPVSGWDENKNGRLANQRLLKSRDQARQYVEWALH